MKRLGDRPVLAPDLSLPDSFSLSLSTPGGSKVPSQFSLWKELLKSEITPFYGSLGPLIYTLTIGLCW